MSGSVAFDPARADYDRTRGLRPEIREAVANTLAEEFAARDPVLEVGVGTGRMALPLVERGVRMVGVDLSPSMLARLRENAGGTAPLPLLLGDATRLPIGDHAAAAVLAVHVLHLIPNWQTAVAEFVRVVRPGGSVVVDVGSPPTPESREITDRLEATFGDVVHNVGFRDGEEAALDETMAPLGARVRYLPEIVDTEPVRRSEWLERIRDGVLSWTWQIPREERIRGADEVRAWAEERYGDLNVPREAPRIIRFRAYDVAD
jgi:ubiquinone/menaquinone biosynthesis C-methylase UbiE